MWITNISWQSEEGWSCLDDFRTSIVGQNLLERKYAEAEEMCLDSVPTEIERGMYGMITWRR